MKKLSFIFLILLSVSLTGQIVLDKPDSDLIARNHDQVQVAALLVDTIIDVKDHVVQKNSEDNITHELNVLLEGAYQLNCYFEKFYLPNGTSLAIKNALGTVVFTYDHTSNPSGLLFAIPPINGQELTFTIIGDISNVQILISEVGYFFRSQEELSSSGYCEVNVNCSEGDEWQNQKNGVVRLLLKTSSSTVYCSGSIMNNTARNCRPFIFSAEHCMNNVSANNLKQSFAYFNYETTTCSSENASASNFLLGMSLVSSSSFNNGSDFLLLELDKEIPLEYNAYYNGWNREDGLFSNGVGIHHPKGDVKKVSTFETQLTTPNPNGLTDDAYWEVTWAETNNGHGVTESGSSGGPIFNQEKLVVGALSVGTSYCSKPTDPDYYGKLSYSWSEKTDSSERLDVWLDPLNSGENSLTGSYFPCDDTTKHYIPKDSVVILGNPVSTIMKVYIEQAKSADVEVQIFSVTGSLVFKKAIEAANILNEEIPVLGLLSGTYYLRVRSEYLNRTIPFVILNF